MSKQIRLPQNFQPRDIDILCGRGRGAWNHTGNRRFKTFVNAHAQQYASSKTKMDKGALVASMVDKLREEGVLFVRKDTKTQTWYDIGEYQAREKTSHAIRDTVYKTSCENQLKPKRRRSEEISKQIHNEVRPQQQALDGLFTPHQLSFGTHPISTSLVNVPLPHLSSLAPRQVSQEILPTEYLVERVSSDTLYPHNVDISCEKPGTCSLVPECKPNSPGTNTILLDKASTFLDREMTYPESSIDYELEEVETMPTFHESGFACVCEDDERLPWSELFPIESLHNF